MNHGNLAIKNHHIKQKEQFNSIIMLIKVMNKNNLDVPLYVEEHYSNGSRYEGDKLNGMRHGNGRFYY